MNRSVGQVEQGVDLRDGAVHAPAAAHLAPVDYVALHRFGESHIVAPVISV